MSKAMHLATFILFFPTILMPLILYYHLKLIFGRYDLIFMRYAVIQLLRLAAITKGQLAV
jgi:hypothetical protein